MSRTRSASSSHHELLSPALVAERHHAADPQAPALRGGDLVADASRALSSGPRPRPIVPPVSRRNTETTELRDALKIARASPIAAFSPRPATPLGLEEVTAF